EEYLTYWSGQRIVKYKVRWDSTSVYVLARAEAENVYFGSKPLRLGAETNVVTDRLGSVRRDVRDYFPYGPERTSTYPGDQEKYATYEHDAATDLSYADQRYYATGAGRFMSADRYRASAGVEDPGSWNRYAYVGGDPLNFSDPAGLMWCWVTGYTGNNLGHLRCVSNDTSNYVDMDFHTPLIPRPGQSNRDRARVERAAEEAWQDAANRFVNMDEFRDFDLMGDAIAIAKAALQNRPECMRLFGTEATRAAGWNPVDVMTEMFSRRQTNYGTVNFDLRTVGTAAVISPSGLPSGLLSFSQVSVSINRRFWNMNDARDNARTLLHEMAHAYNYLTGSGGSGIGSNIREIFDPYFFENKVVDNCVGIP
ncbi:MAG: RHS repeat-associated core domain-containing protein, partial [Bryobacterales bacterium]|nr:RHS repeat-associated core domain-containing protein [Bryobacterales bacterium]